MMSAASRTAPKVIVGLRRIAVANEKRRGGRTRSSVIAVMSVPDAWIEKSVGDVDEQVHQDLGSGEYQDQPLHHRIVTLQHGIDGEAPEPRNVEHRLGDD